MSPLPDSFDELNDSRTALREMTDDSAQKKASCNLWRRRTHLEKCLLIAFGILFLSIGFVILGVILRSKIITKIIQSFIDPSEVCETSDCLSLAASFASKIDLSIDPCDNFYEFVCGKWIRDNPLSGEELSKSLASEIYDSQMSTLREILIDNPKCEKSCSPSLVKAQKFYLSCMNTELINEKGFSPAYTFLQNLGGFQMSPSWQGESFDISELLRRMMVFGFEPLFSISPFFNLTDPTKLVVLIDSPEASTSISEPHSFAIKKKHVTKDEIQFVESIFKMASPNRTLFQNVSLALECISDLRKLQSPKSLDNFFTLKTEMTLQELSIIVPEISWRKMLEKLLNLPVKLNEKIYVYNKDFLRNISSLIQRYDRKTLQNSLLALYSLDVLGELITSESNSRWKFCINALKNMFGELVAAEYVNSFPEKEMKAYQNVLEEMFTNIKEALKENVKTLGWMDKSTLVNVLDKIDYMTSDFVTSEMFKNKSYIESTTHNRLIDQDEFFINVMECYKSRTAQVYMAFTDGIVRSRIIWTVLSLPFTINAFYVPVYNSIVIPLGYLKPPYFNVRMPAYINYGSIGSTLGHEVTHGFDTVGSFFDRHGLQNLIWSNEVEEKFHEYSQCFVKQYGSQKFFLKTKTAFYNISINGEKTLDENIADNGGLKISFAAYKKWSSKYGLEKPLSGLRFTVDQLFFIAATQEYCSNYSPHLSIHLIKNDEHTIIPYRINVMMMNSKDFAKAFNCPNNSRMNPSSKCSLW